MPGEGSIFHRGDGRWIAQLSIGGRLSRRYRTRTCATRAEARAALAELRDEEARGTTTSKTSLGDYLVRWVDEVRNIRPATRKAYRDAIVYHIAPTLGGIALRDLSPLHVESAINAWADSGASPKSQRNWYSVLRRALAQAQRAGLVTRNVATAAFVDAPRVPAREPRSLSVDEVHRLLTAASGDPLEPLIITAIGTGLRQGELLGLAWEDIDLGTLHPEPSARRGPALSDGDGAGGDRDHRLGGPADRDPGRRDPRLVVRYELVRRAGRYHREEPKTPRSRRMIPLPPAVAAALREHRERLIAEGFVPTATGPVFCAHDGGPLNGTSVTHRVQRLMESAGIFGAEFRTLRATYASRLFEAGVADRTIADMLGHTRTAVTHGHYIASGAGQDEAIAAAERLVGG